MDGKGGCCIARYRDGGGGSAGAGADGRYAAYDMSKIDRIMLRYRPIAPKPIVGGGNGSPGEAQNHTGAGAAVPGNKSVKTGRVRRRYRTAAAKGGASSGHSSGSSHGGGRKRKSARFPGGGSGSCRSGCGETRSRTDGSTTIHEQGNYDDPILPSPPTQTGVVTLPLLPESPDLGVIKQKGTEDDLRIRNNPPIRLNFDYNPTATVLPNNNINTDYGSPPPTVGSVVTVECITDTWIDDGGSEIGGLTDQERHKSLEKDTCPGFISDGLHRVWWTNDAYKKMLVGSTNNMEETTWKENQQGGGVLLVMGEKLVTPPVPLNYRAFTCRVKVRYYCDGTGTTPGDARESKNKKRVAMATFPCDVWRLENGNGFAWRMDVKAALSLGL